MSRELAARFDAASERDQSLELRDALAAGQSIHYGRYLIHGVLGRGSFATVYDGEHVGLGRRVAIKVPRLRSDDMPSLHERFVREARTSVLVQHPNVLGIYDCGMLTDGTPFLVLERVNGDSLTTIIARGPLSFELVIELGQQLARALSALQDVGIVHRDIKPDNVMLHRSKYGIMLVKLVDFGVAKRSTWQAPISLTLKGELVGTPQYMAAEQLRGEEVDGRTDIYAVAAVLYEALTGQPPHESNNFSDYLIAALSAPVKPIRTLRPDCPPALEKIILRGLERDRAHRQTTPEQLLEELDELKVQLRLDGATTRAAAHAMAADLQESEDSLFPRGPLAGFMAQAKALYQRLPQVALRDPWRARFASAREGSTDVTDKLGEVTRRVAPNMPRVSLLICLVLFTRSESLGQNFDDAESPLGTPHVTTAAKLPASARPGGEPAPLSSGHRGSADNGSTALDPSRSADLHDPVTTQQLRTPPRGAEMPRSLGAGAKSNASSPATPRVNPGAANVRSRAEAPRTSTPSTVALAPTRPAPSAERASAASRALLDSSQHTDKSPASDESTDNLLASLVRGAKGSLAEREAAPATAAQAPAPASAPVSSLLAQAMTAFVSGRLDESKTKYQQVLRTQPNNPAALRGLGLAASRLGEKAVARDSLRRYLEVSPSAPDATAIQARLATLSP